eukprot:1626703-Rhodomonas_salina.1
MKFADALNLRLPQISEDVISIAGPPSSKPPLPAPCAELTGRWRAWGGGREREEGAEPGAVAVGHRAHLDLSPDTPHHLPRGAPPPRLAPTPELTQRVRGRRRFRSCRPPPRRPSSSSRSPSLSRSSTSLHAYSAAVDGDGAAVCGGDACVYGGDGGVGSRSCTWKCSPSSTRDTSLVPSPFHLRACSAGN